MSAGVDTGKTVTVTAKLAHRDVFAYSMWNLFDRNIVLKIIMYFTMLCLALFPLSFVLRNTVSEFKDVPLRFHFYLLLLPFVHFMNVVMIFFMSRRVFMQNRFMREEIRYAFGDEGVQVSTDTRTSRHQWSMYGKVVETRRHFLFFYPDAMAHLIPKRCFKGTEELDRLREVLRDGLGDKARLR
jgi:hypothetical protein